MSTELYSVSEFCAAHSISRAFFYRLVADGRGPQIVKLGDRTLITRKAAAEWRAALTQQKAEPTAPARP